MTINELVDASLLRRTASVRNISQYWNIDDVLPKRTLNRFMQASLRLIIYNPDKFLKYRWQTFAYTNGLYPGYINHPGGECIDAINKLVYYGNDYKSYFAFMNPPFGQALREKTISFLACRHYEQDNIRTNAMLPVFYNCIPGVIFLLVLFISNWAVNCKICFADERGCIMHQRCMTLWGQSSLHSSFRRHMERNVKRLCRGTINIKDCKEL